MKALYVVWVVCLVVGLMARAGAAQTATAPAVAEAPAGQAAQAPELTAAVLGFAAGENLPEDMGQNLSALLFTYMSTETDINLVEREQVDKALSEVGLGMSGMASTDSAVKVGHLVGAKVLITGRVFSLNREELTIVVKIIGAETGRVFALGAQSKGPGDLNQAVKDLATQVGEKIKANAKLLVAATAEEKSRAEVIAQAIGQMKKPTVVVLVSEQHTGPLIIDPAAETEVSFYLTECGFKVVDKDAKLKKGWAAQIAEADQKKELPPELISGVQVVLIGEAVSEFALKKGDLYSCKARVELKAIDTATGEVLAIDRQTEAGVDVAESTAAKAAIQKAAGEIAERLIPKFVAQWNAAHK